MHLIRTIAAALAFAVLAAGCGQVKSAAIAPVQTNAKAMQARIEKMRSATFKLKADKPADMAALAAAMPKTLALTWDKLQLDEATGATVLTGAKLSQTDGGATLVTADKLSVWGLDVDLLRARFAGQRLQETAPLARRIEAEGLKLNFASLLGDTMSAYEKSLGRLASPAGAPVPVLKLDADTTTYTATVGRIVVDDLRLRPWELKTRKLDDGNEWATALPAVQTLVAGFRSIALDTLVYYDTSTEAALSIDGAPSTVSVQIKDAGVRGMRGGDVDFASIDGTAMNMSMPASTLGPATKLTASVDRESLSAVRLDKLAGYLARGEMPPRTETSLLSLGVLSYDGFREAVGGHDLFSVKSVMLDGSGFYWAIPTHARLKITGVTYDVDGFMSYMREAMGATNPEYAKDLDPRIIEALNRHGLAKPTMDMEGGWDWDATTGAAHLDGRYSLNGYLDLDFKADGALPNFKNVSDLIPGGFETAKQDELSALFQKDMLVKSAEMNLTDKGGLDNGFQLAVEIMALLPADQQQSLGPLRNATPASLRQLAYSAVYMAADEYAKTEPRQREMMRSVAAFIEKGGALHLRIEPDKPLPLSQLGGGMSSSQELLDMLHLTLVNDPPAGAKKN
ncbi:MAG: hypothetical protein GC155_10820 [Alphaproteobacteria bacterium]|nr:hypothetical protein [Alphaproteobacteria bacterium]